MQDKDQTETEDIYTQANQGSNKIINEVINKTQVNRMNK